MAASFREALAASFTEIDGRYVFRFGDLLASGEGRYSLELEPMIGGGFVVGLYEWQDGFFAQLMLNEKVPILPFPSSRDADTPESVDQKMGATMGVVHGLVAAMRRAEFEASEQMSLGQFIDALQAIADLRQPIQFDNGTHPWEFTSYRGYYDELSLVPHDDPGVAVFADAVLREALQAVGATFQGYKGGDYQMTRDTPLWCAKWGESGSLAIVGVEDVPDRVGIVIRTKEIDR